MIKNSAENIPQTQSPSITQETKDRFNELLNAALSRDVSDETKLGLLKKSTNTNRTYQNEQPEFVPKAVPRRKRLIKNPDINIVEKDGNSESNNSYEEGSVIKKNSRQVIAEVHSSRTRLLLSSSDDDILSEKKEKKKRKKSKWKQVAETAKKITLEGQENESFQVEEDLNRNSPARLSNRSYTVETPTFALKDMEILTSRSQGSNFKDLPSKNTSPSRLSCRSYTIDIPTIPDSSDIKDHCDLQKIKTPVPLPRRKSLMVIHNSNEDDSLKSPTKTKDVTNYESDIRMKSRGEEMVITLLETAPYVEGDSNISESAVARLQGSVEHTEDDGDMPLAVKKQKRKKKRRKRSKSRDQLEMQELSLKSQADINSLGETSQYSTIKGNLSSDVADSEPQHNGEKIVGVTIHGVDCPLVDSLVRHPMVRLFIVDTSTGEYFNKSDPNRSVCYFEESTSYVPPIMTHPFDFRQQKSMQPLWEECLVLNENISHLLKPETLLLFELCDFLPVSLAASIAHHRKLGSMAGWHLVAWAFLRPVVADGTLNVGSRLRLQLYKPAKYPKSLRSRIPVVYEWWGTAVRHKYPACLYVTVSAIDPPTAPISPQLRSRMALQSERGSEASVRSASASVAVSEVNSDDNHEQEERTGVGGVVWSRLPAQICKIPNTQGFTLPVVGSMCVEFSSCGQWLACARLDVMVFSVPQFVHTVTLSGHQGLIYSLKWSFDSKILLSASADCTICVWRPSHRRTLLLQMLAHPSFVYCTQFVPSRGSCTLVSGCYDGLLRLWQGDTHSSYQLVQELYGASSNAYITAVCVTTDGTRVVSADSHGGLRMYEVDDDGSLTGGRELRVREVRGKIISNVLVHPGGHRLLVHTRDSLIRSVDIATGAVIQSFKGIKNDHVQTGVCVSPCGSLVFACGEDGTLMAWDGHTGSLRAVYCSLLPPGSAAVHYHPHDHMLAVGSLVQAPVYILTFNRSALGEEIGLNIIDNESTAAKIINSMKESDKWQKALPKVAASSSHHSIVVQDGGSTKGKNKYKEAAKQGDNIRPLSSCKWPSLPKFDSCIDTTSEDKDLRLLEIIQKMDSIILAAKQSSQP